MKRFFLILILPALLSCSNTPEGPDPKLKDGETKTIVKKRDDGTLSSVNQVDEEGKVHGVRVTYFADGKTVYTKFSCKHGKKHGPFIRYYNNGQVYEHSNFKDGKRHGSTKKYYKDGSLMAEFDYKQGVALTGLKEYDKRGELIDSYPFVEFREVKHLATHNRIDLEIHCSEPYNGTKYFLVNGDNQKENRTYLITEKGFAMLQLYVQPGETLSRKIELLAEIPTELGHIYVRRCTHQVNASNTN